MSRPPDPVVALLDRRIDELERALVSVVGVAAIALLVVGGLLPWLTDFDEEGSAVSLLTAPFGFFSMDSEERSVDLVFGLSFLLLAVMTVATVVCICFVMVGQWSGSWIGMAVLTLLACCVVGAGLTSLLAAAHDAEDVRWSGYLLWSSGALVSRWVLTTRLGRRLTG